MHQIRTQNYASEAQVWTRQLTPICLSLFLTSHKKDEFLTFPHYGYLSGENATPSLQRKLYTYVTTSLGMSIIIIFFLLFHSPSPPSRFESTELLKTWPT